MSGKMEGGQTVRTVALAGNPNVGKSTIFNALTGMHQHTGNWPGKTVARAEGICSYKGEKIRLVDLPGTYALVSKSQEEAVAAAFIAGGEADCVVAVCDATSLERSLILALQVLELTDQVVVCVNLMDEAQKRGITIDMQALSFALGVPVVPVSAGREEGLDALCEQLRRILDGFEKPRPRRCGVVPESIRVCHLGAQALHGASEEASDEIAGRFVQRAEEIAQKAVRTKEESAKSRAALADRLLTGRWTGALSLVLLLGVVFWLTIQGANVPSALLQRGFDALQAALWAVADSFHAPAWLSGALLEGVYQTTAKVVAVMLPPVLIFFPLFTLLEDAGYLPRVAFLMDAGFERCGSCGKQALTMCMGFGCNAAGVSGCRIIDSERERLIGMLTNSLVPCNGRFPTLLTLGAVFFGGGSAWTAALILTGCVLLGVAATMFSSLLLGKSVLRGAPSHFTLELPPFRRPQLGRVIVRSFADRSLFVLLRAVAVAAPAGLLLWLLGSIELGGVPALLFLSQKLEPAGRFLGMNGAILLAFFLSFPANELLLPVFVMILSSGAGLAPAGGEMGGILVQAGWTAKTAVCVMVFTLFHWPCSTTALTIRKESGSVKWTLCAMALPTVIGILLCAIFNRLL